MKRLLLTATLAVSVMPAIAGCGGHEGGVVDVPLNENPYQISDQEQQAMNAAIVDTAPLTEEEIAAIEEEKKKAAQEAEGQPQE